MVGSHIYTYIDIIRCFTRHRINAKDFANVYTIIYLRCSGKMKHEEYEALNNLYYYVEDYYDDPSMRDEGDPDETKLLKEAAETLHKLEKLL
ncbi:colicin immunity domain-containing protein [Desulfovibrio ferrophilus]|uniref:Colicin D immunity protein domain-containing protein n=1 Tax=Desulfovibrio ferrophilus TaxID=241368 RepID=A0A2Z6B183_9BACT|nr:colicin immunity domain-containing protein [Desulfovibrio ferrophilus]BBD09279.1 uncharacterized protein DFE_2553 [Desulfovibrio ferrophilus]